MIQPESPGTSLFSARLWRRFSLAFFSLAFLFCLIAGLIYRKDNLHQSALLEQESVHVLNLQQKVLQFEFRAVQSDLLYLATQPKLVQVLSGDLSARPGLSREYVNLAKNKRVYEQIRCLDSSGEEIVRVNYRDGVATVVPEHMLQSKAKRYYFKQAHQTLRRGEVFVSSFDLNVEHGVIEQPPRPVIRFLTPVVDKSDHIQGFLVLNYLGAQILTKLKQVAVGFRGQAMLINSQGDYLQAPDQQHEWGWLLGHQESFRTHFPRAWTKGRSDNGPFHLEGGIFGFRRLLPGNYVPHTQSVQDDVSLILATRVSRSVVNAHAKEMLSQLTLMYIAVLGVVALLSFYWARVGLIRRDHEQRIAESETRLRLLSSMLLASQESERRTLSRDLHDELGQLVTAIGLDLRSLDKKVDQSDINDLLRRVINETDHLLESIHEIATRVRPTVLDDLGLRDAIESAFSDYHQRTGIAVQAQLNLDRADISPLVGENVFRVLQEALANVASHAQVKQVSVVIETNPTVVTMEIRDEGVGFDASDQADTGRLGILGMRERVELLHGQFDLVSERGEGTWIRVAIPIDQTNNKQ